MRRTTTNAMHRGTPTGSAASTLSYETKFALTLSVASLLLLVGLSFGTSSSYLPEDSLFVGSSQPQHRRYLEDGGGNKDGLNDYSDYSCHLIREITTSGSQSQCTFAKTCGGGEGLWAPIVFCSSHSKVWLGLLSPIMMVWLILLFRMLGSTAEDYFSPSLEMFSTQLGLPPRFAGVTLLALGNGAADVSATQSAVTGDPQHGYQLSLGALTGAAMMIGSVVSAVVIITAEGVPCRGALVRDVTALLVTVLVVWKCLSLGVVTPETITIFLSMYGTFVMLVLCADVYHRRVVLPRMAMQAQERERQRQLDEADAVQRQIGLLPGASPLSHVLTALSNYDRSELLDGGMTGGGMVHDGDGSGWGVESDDLQHERPVVLHGSHGILGPAHHHASGGGPNAATTTTSPPHDNSHHNSNYTMLHDDPTLAVEGEDVADPSRSSTHHMMMSSSTVGASYQSWNGFVYQLQEELAQHFAGIWDDIYWNGDVHALEKILLTLELPVVLLRQCTVAIPCEGYYVRSLVALSLALSPTWFAYYLWRNNDIVVFGHAAYYVYWAVLLLIAAAFARFAPVQVQDLHQLSPYISVPIALYGFAMAATWIDTIADALVSLLNFIGVLLSIPSSVLGLTLLAWGNSMSDLSANVTMARKGLANMAITACFAGPVFNILVGLGLGFSSLAAQTGQSERQVTLSPSVVTGFAFTAASCACLLVTGVVLCRATIPKMYGYASLALYAAYVATGITLQYAKFGGGDGDG